MLNPNDSIFKYEDWLDNNEGEPSYNYYVETTKKRKEILSAMGTPYFEEIKQRTKGIQDKLKKEGYEDIDLQLKSLFVDGIEFFLNSDTDEPQLDNKKRLYLKGLFDSLMINTENKKLLNNILSELKNGGEKLPPSPIDFLIDYKEKKSFKEIEQTKTMTPRLNRLGDGHPSFTRQISIEEIKENIAKITSKMEKLQSRDGRLEGKTFMQGHCAFDDSDRGLKLFGENVVIYSVGDNYIPSSNHGKSIELLNKVNNASVEELEEMYIRKSDINDLNLRRHIYKNNKEAYIKFLKEIILEEFFNFLYMYAQGERFEVVKSTYNDIELACGLGDDDKVSCWFVDIRSKKTGKTYRVLSE